MRNNSFNKLLRTELGHQIWMLRTQKNLTQMAIAEHIGISYQQIQKYEYGNSSISIERLFQICDALEAHPSELIASVLNALNTNEQS